MKFRSRKTKPPVGMEMGVTFSVSPNLDAEQSAAALVRFLETVSSAANEIGALWVRVHCIGIPEALEDKLQAAFDKANKKPTLQLVIDNERP